MATYKDLKEKYLEKLGDTIQVFVHPLYNEIPSGIKYEMPINIIVTGGKLPEGYTRKPLELCVVLDKSGSMSGSRMNYSKVAINNIIKNMKEDDILHFITYSEYAETIFRNKRKADTEEMLRDLEKVQATGSTNIFAGIKQAVEILRSSEDERYVKTLFLFSDGEANEGYKGERIGIETHKICEGSEIKLMAYGIGNTYNEKLMNSLSVVGKGKLFHINSNDTIDELVQLGIDHLTKFWSKDAKIVVYGARGTQVTKFEGCKNMLVGKRFKIREYSMTSFSLNAETYNIGDRGALNVEMTYVNEMDGQTRLEKKVCEWMLVDYSDWEDKPHPMMTCFQTVQKCKEINEEILEMIKKQAREELVIKKKERIVELYEEAQEQDPYMTLPALLKREKNVLKNFKEKGVYSAKSMKKFNYAGQMAGNKGNAYDYVGECEEEEDEDSEEENLGLGLFGGGDSDDDSDDDDDDEEDEDDSGEELGLGLFGGGSDSEDDDDDD